MKYVVVHHAHHPDEGVYRLVFAEEREDVRLIERENPEFDPERPRDPDNLPLQTVEEPVVVHVNHQQVVWADDDRRWQRKTPKRIAAAQREIVSARITETVAEGERRERDAAAAQTDLGGVGEVL